MELKDRNTSSNNKVLKSGIWYVISNVMIRAVGILTAPIYTRLLSTSETGFANNFNNYVSIFTVITCLCLIYSVGKAKLDFKEDFDKYMSSIQTLSSLFGLAVFIIVFFACPINGMLGMPRNIFLLLFAYLILFPSIDYMQYKYRFEYRYKENIAISVIITVTTVLCSIGLMLAMPSARGYAKIYGTVIPSAAAAIWCYLNILRKGRCLVNLKFWRYALIIGLPMIPHGLAMILLARIDVSMIGEICGMSEVGLYTSGYTIGTLLMFVTNAIGQAWLPWFNERLDAGERSAIRDKAKLLVAGGCIATFLFVAAAPEAVKLLFAKNYWDSMWVIPPVALGTLCQYFYTNYVNLEIFYKKTYLIAVNSCIYRHECLGYTKIRIYRCGLYNACGLCDTFAPAFIQHKDNIERKDLCRCAAFRHAPYYCHCLCWHCVFLYKYFD